jgi:SAM-dependent methyltransferase
MDLKEQASLGAEVATHWYYRAKASALQRYLPADDLQLILDIGAGSGFFTKHLLQCGHAREGVCVDVNYSGDHDEWIGGKPVHYRRQTGEVPASLVLMMDVIEHVDDDCALLHRYAALVPSGAAFLITVPAFQFLWSSHDVFLQHRRRYTIDQLENTVRTAGLSVVRSCYFFGMVFPLAAAVRLADRFRPRQASSSHLRRHSKLVNALLLALCRIDLALFRWNRLAGLTVMCLARKA